MRARKQRWRVIGIFVPLVTILSACIGASQGGRTIAFTGAQLIDGTGRQPVADSVLAVEGGKILAVGKRSAAQLPPGAQVVDLTGKTVMPLLIDLHAHLGLTVGIEQSATNYTEENIWKQLETFLAYGVGTVVSLGSDQDLIYRIREAQRAGNLPAARVYTAGRGFGVKGGYPPTLVNAEDRYRPQTPEEAREDVRRLAALSPNFVKIWVDDDFGRLPKMQPEIYRAIVEEAHRHHLRVVAHVFYLADAKELLRAGIDGFGHSIRDRDVDSELVAALKGRRVFLTPTLVRDESTFAYAEEPPWLSDPFFQAETTPQVLETLRSPAFKEKFRKNLDLAKYRAAFEMAKKNLKAVAAAGVRIGFGTDSGPPLRFQGYFEHRELQLMVESGLAPMQAIVIATGGSAQILGARDLGTLEPGKQADFIVLDASPLDDIRNTEKISAVYQAGKRARSVRPR